MNKVDFSKAGGFPFAQEDLNFMQNSNISALAMIAKALSFGQSDSLILYGCANTVGLSGAGNYTGGAIVFKGEVCAVDNGTVIALTSGQTYNWIIDDTHDATGDDVFENGVAVQTYRIRKAKVVNAVYNGAIHQRVSTMVSFSDYSKNNVDSLHLVGASGEPAFAAGIVNTIGGLGAVLCPLSFKKVANMLFVNGHIKYTGGGITGATLFTLPDSYIPALVVGTLQSYAFGTVFNTTQNTMGYLYLLNCPTVPAVHGQLAANVTVATNDVLIIIGSVPLK